MELDGCCSWTAATTLLDEVYAFLRTFRWTERSWSGCCCYPAGRGVRLPSYCQLVCAKLATATFLLDEVYIFLQTARRSAQSWSGCCCYLTGRSLLLPPCRLVEACLEVHAAASCSGVSCWRSQECPASSLSRVLCCRLCLTLAEINQAWKQC